MPNVLRRRLLVTVRAAALTVVPRPFPALTDLFDKLLGHSERKATKPITPNDEFYITPYRSPPTSRVDAWSLSVTGHYPTEKMSQLGHATETFCATASSFTHCTWKLKPPGIHLSTYAPLCRDESR